MATRQFPASCRRCKSEGKEFIASCFSEMYSHNRDVHGYINGRRPEYWHDKERRGIIPKSESALDRILEHRRGIAEAARELDVERAQLTERIKRIDDEVARYKAFTAGL